MKWPKWRNLVRNEVLEQTNSDKNPHLEVAIEYGKTVLNTEHGNFSFGNLHTVFDEGFKKIKIEHRHINNCLLLGLGGGSVLDLLINKYPIHCPFSVVEHDPKIVELAQKYFGLDNYKDIDIHIVDAFEYVKSCNKKFDLIIVDLYNDLNVPEQAHTREFATDIGNILKTKGLVIFNKVVIHKIEKQQYNNLYNHFHEFCTCKTIQVLGMNNLLVAEKI
ncbi:MAG: fused MFS/spermidine synthase [Bacteroidota bacterium]|nr:fused MFS/spermidine synthase [Bacteroidota bacterium]